jgi:hypothetical protein
MLEYVAQCRTDVVVVGFVDLVSALVVAADGFSKDLARDQSRASAAEDKARRWMAWVPAPLAV